MAYSINQVFLVGNVARDPELKFTQGGTAFCNFSMATSRGVKKGDQWENVSTFHKIVVWGKLAEQVGNSLTKGQRVTISGRIDNRSYDGKDGTKKYISEVVADSVIFDSRQKSTVVDADDGVEQPPQEPSEAQAEDVADDIPF